MGGGSAASAEGLQMFVGTPTPSTANSKLIQYLISYSQLQLPVEVLGTRSAKDGLQFLEV